MRGKRSKQYRKLMHQYELTFNFREPFQVLVDANIVKDACRFKMDLAGALKRTLHGQVKPMITTCSMRHLYADTDNQEAISLAKAFERRRCNHHTLEKPLSTKECLQDVVDSKGSRTNKHRYVVASQEPSVRSYLRSIPGVPLVYIARSVMIMEPMAQATGDVRLRDERSKFKQGLKMRTGANSILGKRAREQDGEEMENEVDQTEVNSVGKQKKKKPKGPKGPNPLSVMKPKKRDDIEASENEESQLSAPAGPDSANMVPGKRKRSRKSSKKAESALNEESVA